MCSALVPLPRLGRLNMSKQEGARNLRELLVILSTLLLAGSSNTTRVRVSPADAQLSDPYGGVIIWV